MNLPFYLAVRHLKSTQKGSFTKSAAIFSILGLAIGIAALLLTLFIVKGFEKTISTKIANFDGHLRIRHFLGQPIQASIPELDSLLTSFPQTVNRTRFIQSPALLRKGRIAEGVLVEGVEPEGAEFLSEIMVDGIPDLIPGSIIIGHQLAKQFHVGLGQKLVLFDLESLESSIVNRRVKSYTVTGIFHSGLGEYDASLVYLNLTDANTLFSMGGKVSGHVLRMNTVNLVSHFHQQLEEALSYPYMAISWKEKNRTLFKWMDIQRWPILMIFGLIALVGIVNIVSALTMIIVEKVRQIGILNSLGLHKAHLKYLFYYQAIIIGIAGSAIGVGMAVVLAEIQLKFKVLSIPEDVYFMDHVPMDIDGFSIVIVFIVGIAGASLSSIWPTYRIGKIMPADALRYE